MRLVSREGTKQGRHLVFVGVTAPSEQISTPQKHPFRGRQDRLGVCDRHDLGGALMRSDLCGLIA